MQIAGRELSGEHDVNAIMLYRSLVGLITILPIALMFGGVNNIVTGRPVLHLTRNAIHFLGQMSWFYGIAHLAMADVSALNAMVPIFGIVLAIIFMGERLSGPRVIAIAFGFVGVLTVIRPGVVPLEIATYITLFGSLFYAVFNRDDEGADSVGTAIADHCLYDGHPVWHCSRACRGARPAP